MEFTKESVEHLKANDPAALTAILNNGIAAKDALFILQNLGHLPENFDGDVFMKFVSHKTDQVRFWAVKNLGKLCQIKYAEWLYVKAKMDSSSTVRREAVSALGRFLVLPTIEIVWV